MHNIETTTCILRSGALGDFVWAETRTVPISRFRSSTQSRSYVSSGFREFFGQTKCTKNPSTPVDGWGRVGVRLHELPAQVHAVYVIRSKAFAMFTIFANKNRKSFARYFIFDLLPCVSGSSDSRPAFSIAEQRVRTARAYWTHVHIISVSKPFFSFFFFLHALIVRRKIHIKPTD